MLVRMFNLKTDTNRLVQLIKITIGLIKMFDNEIGDIST